MVAQLDRRVQVGRGGVSITAPGSQQAAIDQHGIDQLGVRLPLEQVQGPPIVGLGRIGSEPHLLWRAPGGARPEANPRRMYSQANSGSRFRHAVKPALRGLGTPELQPADRRQALRPEIFRPLSQGVVEMPECGGRLAASITFSPGQVMVERRGRFQGLPHASLHVQPPGDRPPAPGTTPVGSGTPAWPRGAVEPPDPAGAGPPRESSRPGRAPGAAHNSRRRSRPEPTRTSPPGEDQGPTIRAEPATA